MFGRRRAPILGTAVVIGASRAAARREVAYQNLAANAAETQRRADQIEQDRRTQLAIDEAIAAERRKNEEAAQSGGKGQAQGYAPPNQPPQYSVDQNKAAGAFYCGACGELSSRNDKFCSNCGRRHPTNDAVKVDL
jgi:hypothetical protein